MMNKHSKFNVNKNTARRTCNGIVFDSELEMKYFRDVVLPLTESGEIKYYELQKSYELQPKFTYENKSVRAIIYVADFYIEYTDGRIEVIDTKGMADTTAILKRKMFWYHYPNTTYKWLSYTKATGWIEYDKLKKIRSAKKRAKKETEIVLQSNKDKQLKNFD